MTKTFDVTFRLEFTLYDIEADNEAEAQELALDYVHEFGVTPPPTADDIVDVVEIKKEDDEN